MTSSFDRLVDEAARVPVDGWDFSWLQGRATEERPSWGYQKLLAERLPTSAAALDVQTGGGEVLAGLPRLAPLTVATEGWPPNVVSATRLLHPRGVAVVADADEPPLPFADEAFDLVVSRHPVRTWWEEVHRVLRPEGTYLSQQIGPHSVRELSEHFLGAAPAGSRHPREPEDARLAAEAAGLVVTDLRSETLRMEFFDIGAVVYFLRKVVWTVPGFSVERHRDELRQLHALIEDRGRFVAHSTRFLIEARRGPRDVEG